MSFYYWNPVFSLDTMEKKVLRDNAVQTLYVRYFDVDWSPADTAPVPAAPLQFATPPSGYTIIPVICLRNRIFEKLDPAAIPSFAAGLFTRVRGINASQHLQNREIQFDCDWTEKTKENYFGFLQEYQRISVETLSATIRLYQLKYPEKTGIPPVDYGVLLFYTNDDTDTGYTRSVYERPISHRYTPSLRSYPLNLDIALPIFAPNRETKDDQDLLGIITDINQHSNHHIRDLIFFDLDQRNLQQYDQGSFKAVLDHTE